MCGGGADETPRGLRVLEGRWADGYVGRSPVRPGAASVIWTGRHVSAAGELSPGETAGFWSDVSRVAQAVEGAVPAGQDELAAPRQRRAAPARPPGAAVTMLELLAEGRTAEVYAYGEGRVLKLDRPDWNGLSEFEGTMLAALADAGLPVARPHGTVTIEGRRGLILDRVDGPSLLEVLLASGPEQAGRLAGRFAALQRQINATAIAGLPDLVPRLRREVEASVPGAALRAELLGLLAELDDGARGVCHYDLHPLNVLTGPDGWVVIDWLTVAAGPPAADLARTLVLWGRWSTEPVVTFLRAAPPCRRGRRRARPGPARRLGPRRRRGAPGRGLRRRGGGVVVDGGGRLGAAVRLSHPGRRLRRPASRDRRCRE